MNDDNPWAYWEALGRGENPPAYINDPQCGYYDWYRRDGGYGGKRIRDPVIYWLDKDGNMHWRDGEFKWKDDKPLPNPLNDAGREAWHHVCRNYQTKDVYTQVAVEGKPYPDGELPYYIMKHNLPPEDDSFDALRYAVENLGREAEQRLEGPTIANKDEADKISNLADRLAELDHKI